MVLIIAIDSCSLFDARQVQLEINEHIISTFARIGDKLDKLSARVADHDLLLQKGL